jgi:hypothetical protein
MTRSKTILSPRAFVRAVIAAIVAVYAAIFASIFVTFALWAGLSAV